MKASSPINWILSACARLAAVCAFGMVAGAPAMAADPNKLQAIDVQTLPGQQVQLTMRLSGPATEPLSFTIDNPARISFDLPNTALALPSRRIEVKAAGLDTILAAEAKDRTRLVLNLDRLLPYETRLDGNNIVVTLGSANPQAAGAAVARAAAPTPSASAAVGPRAIRSIDFRRGSDGAGRVVVKLTDPRTQINQRQLGNQIVVDFSGTELPKNLMRRSTRPISVRPCPRSTSCAPTTTPASSSTRRATTITSHIRRTISTSLRSARCARSHSRRTTSRSTRASA